MEPGIHPEYRPVVFRARSADLRFERRYGRGRRDR